MKFELPKTNYLNIKVVAGDIMLVSKKQEGEAVFFGGNWSDQSYSSSRESYWVANPYVPGSAISIRAASIHLNLESLNKSEGKKKGI